MTHFKNHVTYLDFCKIDKNNKKLLEIRSFSDKQRNKLQDNGGKKEKTETSTVEGKVSLMHNKDSRGGGGGEAGGRLLKSVFHKCSTNGIEISLVPIGCGH